MGSKSLTIVMFESSERRELSHRQEVNQTL